MRVSCFEHDQYDVAEVEVELSRPWWEETEIMGMSPASLLPRWG